MQPLSPEFGLIFWIIFSLIAIVLPVIALIDVLVSRFENDTIKLIWVMVILFLPVIGAIIYFIIGRKQRIASVNN